MPDTKLTRPLTEAIFAMLRKGHYIESAAAKCGIHRDTLHRWRQLGAEARDLARHEPKRDDFATVAQHRKAVVAWNAERRRLRPYLEFLDGFELAHDFGEAWLVEQILDHAANPDVRNNKWTAYMTILERSRRDRWGRRSSVEHGTADGKPLQISHTFDPAKLSDDELDTLQRLLERARPESES